MLARSLDRSIDRIELKLHLHIEYIYTCVCVIQLQRSQPQHLTSVRSIDAKQETVRSDAYECALETRSIDRSVIIGCSFAMRGARRSSDDSLENYVRVVSTKWD